MNKIYYFMTISVGLTIIMYLAGIKTGGQETLMNLFGLDPTNLSIATSGFVITLGISFGIAATIGSIFSKESSVRAGFIIASGVMGIGVGLFVGILNYLNGIVSTQDQWIYYIVFTIFAVYSVGYILSLIEFWGEG